MALIKCPECGKEISDQAETCIHCGYPIQKKPLVTIREREVVVCPKCGEVRQTGKGTMDRVNYYLSQPCPECGNIKCMHYTIINPPSVDEIELFYEYYNNLVGNTIDRELYMKWQNKLRQHNTKNISSPVISICPYCDSINTRKISTLTRAFSTGLFGLGSSKVGKQWHCNKCGSDF